MQQNYSANETKLSLSYNPQHNTLILHFQLLKIQDPADVQKLQMILESFLKKYVSKRVDCVVNCDFIKIDPKVLPLCTEIFRYLVETYCRSIWCAKIFIEVKKLDIEMKKTLKSSHIVGNYILQNGTAATGSYGKILLGVNKDTGQKVKMILNDFVNCLGWCEIYG